MRAVLIRPPRDDEGERLREIARQSKGYWGYDVERVRKWADSLDLSPGGLRTKEFFVAEAAGRPVAWAALIAKGEVCVLDDLWIEPESMGRGIGTKLFEHVLARARELAATRLEWESEPNAVGFYENMGARYLRDSEPGEWGRVNPVMGIALR